MSSRRAASALTLVLLLAASTSRAGDAAPAGGSPGNVRFFKVAGSSFDRYTANPTAAEQRWMRSKYWRVLAYSPYFDTRLSWFPSAWVYKNLYAIYPDSAPANEHPEWILRDASGARLYIPFACAGGACSQYAGDVGDPQFRAFWIAQAAATLAEGYLGLFIDDVNMTLLRVSDGAGTPVAPIDRRTGRAMTEDDWRCYMAELTEQIRAAFPRSEIVHNALWFVGHDDPFVQRELLSANIINLERGVNDGGIRGGTGTFGFDTLLAHVDWLHASGRAVVFDASAPSEASREYGLAAYLVASARSDALGNGADGTPHDWWDGYDVALGASIGPRYLWNGVLRRDFAGGIALVNPPDSAPRTLGLGSAFRDVAGGHLTEITLGPAQGAVLIGRPPRS